MRGRIKRVGEKAGWVYRGLRQHLGYQGCKLICIAYIRELERLPAKGRATICGRKKKV